MFCSLRQGTVLNDASSRPYFAKKQKDITFWQWGQLPVLVVSAHDDAAIVRDALALGAAGFVSKSAPKNEIAKAIDYSLKRWPVFTRFLDDVVIPLERDPRWGHHGPTEAFRLELVAAARSAGIVAPQVAEQWGGLGLGHRGHRTPPADVLDGQDEWIQARGHADGRRHARRDGAHHLRHSGRRWLSFLAITIPIHAIASG